MISALRNDTRIIAPLSQKDIVRKYSKAGELYCPVCRQAVIFRAGDHKIWHFAHSPGASECSISKDPDYRPETQEHQVAKALIYSWLTDKLESCEVGMEEHVPATNQFADVLLRTPRGTIAFELQYSPLTGEEWRRRSALYNSARIVDIWLLIGRNYRSPIMQNEDSEATVPVSGLAKAILRERGLVNFLDVNSIGEGLKTPQFMSASIDGRLAKDASLVSVNGIGDHYDVDAASLEEYMDELNARPLTDQHRWFTRLTPNGDDSTLLYPWSEKDIPGRTYKLESNYVHRAGLEGVTINSDLQLNAPKTKQHRPVLLASPRQDEYARKAWAWENANHRWHKKHPERLRELKRHRTRMARDRKILVGKGVASSLPTLYPALLELAECGRRKLSKKTLRSHPALPKPVSKWPAKNWTPLTNIEVPLEWVFGCHRRIWQMVVYCCCFYKKYNEEYLERHEISANASSSVFIGYALKALANELPKDWWRSKPVDAALQNAKGIGQVAGTALEDVPGISVHSLRYIVMSLYFDRLCDIGFLKKWGSVRDTKKTALEVRRLLIDMGTDNLKYRELSRAQLFVMGEKWINLVRCLRQCEEDLRTLTYELTNCFIYPCAVTQKNDQVKEALNTGTLLFKRSGVYDGREPIIKLDQNWAQSKSNKTMRSRPARGNRSNFGAQQVTHSSSGIGYNVSADEDHRVGLPILQPVPAYEDLPRHIFRQGAALKIELAKSLLRRYGYKQAQVDGTHGTFVQFENTLKVTSWGYFCSLEFGSGGIKNIHAEDESFTHVSRTAFVLFAASTQAEVVGSANAGSNNHSPDISQS